MRLLARVALMLPLVVCVAGWNSMASGFGEKEEVMPDEPAERLYNEGVYYLNQIPDVTRDQGRAAKAIEALEEVIRKFPDSEYATSARKKIAEVHDQLAAYEMTIGRYYENKKNFIGAINRFKAVVTRYQRTRHVEEALMRLTECYMSLGVAGEAQTAAAVLGHNFPDSAWYKDAYNIIKSQGLEPQENNGSWISRVFKRVGHPF